MTLKEKLCYMELMTISNNKTLKLMGTGDCQREGSWWEIEEGKGRINGDARGLDLGYSS